MWEFRLIMQYNYFLQKEMTLVNFYFRFLNVFADFLPSVHNSTYKIERNNYSDNFYVFPKPNAWVHTIYKYINIFYKRTDIFRGNELVYGRKETDDKNGKGYCLR